MPAIAVYVVLAPPEIPTMAAADPRYRQPLTSAQTRDRPRTKNLILKRLNLMPPTKQHGVGDMLKRADIDIA